MSDRSGFSVQLSLQFRIIKSGKAGGGWGFGRALIPGNNSQRVKCHPKFTFIQEISGVGVGQLYTDSLENRKVMRVHFNSEATLFVGMASSNHDKHLSMLNSHHEFVRFIKSKVRVVAACVEPTAYDS